MSTETKRPDIAVFIDFENIYVSVREKLDSTPNFESMMDHCSDLGRVVISRAYADWYRYPRITSALYANGIEPVYVPTYYYDKEMGRTGHAIKNSVDMHLCVDAMKTLFVHHHIAKFVLATGDRDFIPLVNSIRQQGKEVLIIGIGGAASTHLAQSADDFIFYEQLVGKSTITSSTSFSSSRKAKSSRTDAPVIAGVNYPHPQPEPEPEPDIYDTLVRAVHLVRERGYISTLGSLKLVMKELMGGDFKEGRYKDRNGRYFTKFKDFVIDAERRGKVQIYTSGTVSEVFLPGEDATKLSQFSDLKEDATVDIAAVSSKESTNGKKEQLAASLPSQPTPPPSSSSRSRRRRRPRTVRSDTTPIATNNTDAMHKDDEDIDTPMPKELPIAPYDETDAMEDADDETTPFAPADMTQDDVAFASFVNEMGYTIHVDQSLFTKDLSAASDDETTRQGAHGDFPVLEEESLFNIGEAFTLSHLNEHVSHEEYEAYHLFDDHETQSSHAKHTSSNADETKEKYTLSAPDATDTQEEEKEERTQETIVTLPAMPVDTVTMYPIGEPSYGYSTSLNDDDVNDAFDKALLLADTSNHPDYTQLPDSFDDILTTVETDKTDETDEKSIELFDDDSEDSDHIVDTVFEQEEWQSFTTMMQTHTKPVSFATIFDSLRQLRKEQMLVRTNEQLRNMIKQAINDSILERSGRGKRVYYTLNTKDN